VGTPGAGIGARNTPYDEKGVVANFRCEKPHRNTAFQWFRKDGVLAYLPLPDQHMSMVWSAPTPSPTSSSRCPRSPLRAGRRSRRQRLGKLELVTPPRPSRCA
jgi:2-polyprenyl-6-methoxyphenol hydroxylase-like FAD-dependent oxidoreductase